MGVGRPLYRQSVACFAARLWDLPAPNHLATKPGTWSDLRCGTAASCQKAGVANPRAWQQAETMRSAGGVPGNLTALSRPEDLVDLLDRYHQLLGMLEIDLDLDRALRKAVIEVVDFLVEERGLSRSRAYSLASIAVDFRIAEAVDLTQVVTGFLPKSVFVTPGS